MVAKDNSHHLAHSIQISTQCGDDFVVVINHEFICLLHVHAQLCDSIYTVITHILNTIFPPVQNHQRGRVGYYLRYTPLDVYREVFQLIVFYLYFFFFLFLCHCFREIRVFN